MPKFKPYDYNQSAMIVINYDDQLQSGTFEHAIHHLIDKKLIYLFLTVITKAMMAEDRHMRRLFF